MRAKTILIAVGVSLLLAGVWFFALWRPQSKALDDARVDQAAAATRLQTETTRLNHLKSLDPEDLARRESVLAAAIPDADQLDEFIVDLNAQAKAAGVEFVSISPQQPITDGAAPTAAAGAAVPVSLQIQASGDYFAVLRFLEEIRDASRLVTVEQFSLAPVGSEGGGFTASIGGRMFINQTAPGAPVAPTAQAS